MVAFLVKWSSMWSIWPQDGPLPPQLQAREGAGGERRERIAKAEKARVDQTRSATS
jgi:hypothetical protein